MRPPKISILFKYHPIIWASGLTAIAYHAPLVLSKPSHFRRIPKELKFLLFFIISYALSILLSTLTGQHQAAERVLASIYNLTYWMAGLSLCLYIKEMPQEKFSILIKSVKKWSRINLITLAILAVFSLSLGKDELSFKSAIAYLVDPNKLPPLIQNSLELKVLVRDWFSGEANARFSGMGIYPTATATTAFLLFVISTIDEKPTSVNFILLLVCGVTTAAACYSRMPMALFVAYSLTTIALQVKKKWRYLILLSIFVASLPIIPSLLNALDSAINSRADSSETRFLIYKLSIDRVIEDNLIFGIGVKPRENTIIPIGSHSTWIGSLLKTGTIGTCLLLIFAASLTRSASSKKIPRTASKNITSFYIVFFTIFFSLEDIDAPQIVSFLFFSIIALHIKLADQEHENNP